MRLPVLGHQAAHIDEAEVGSMVGYAIEHGLNYLDTAYPYHHGQSELTIGRILKGGYRRRINLATKMPCRHVQSSPDFDRFLNEQLGRLQTDHIDYYLLHGLNRTQWPRLRNLGVLDWAERAKSDGRIGQIGFSFHDEFKLFKEIIDDFDHWALCQVQYNYMDNDYQAGTAGVRYAAEKGLAVVIMEPLKGGRLAKEPPSEVAAILAKAPKLRSMAGWGLQWVWDQQEVAVVLSGMSEMKHVVENVALAERCSANRLSVEERQLLEQVRDIYKTLSPINCTQCQYCLPCPQGVSIPLIFQLYNEAIMYGDPEPSRNHYHGTIGLKEDQRADRCAGCGQCESLCPQDLPIPGWLEKAHDLLRPGG